MCVEEEIRSDKPHCTNKNCGNSTIRWKKVPEELMIIRHTVTKYESTTREEQLAGPTRLHRRS